MLISIKKQNIDSESLISYLFYLEELIYKHPTIVGRFSNNLIRDNSLIEKYHIKYANLESSLKLLSIIKRVKNKQKPSYKYAIANKYRINKSRFLITLFLCVGINCFDGHKKTEINKSNFSFIKVLNGIDKSLKPNSNALFKTNNYYEQILSKYTYESLSNVVSIKQFRTLRNKSWEKTTIIKFFETINKDTSRFQSLSNDALNTPIPFNDEELVESLTSISKLYFFKPSIYIPNSLPSISIQSSSLSLHFPSSIYHKSYINLYNCVIY